MPTTTYKQTNKQIRHTQHINVIKVYHAKDVWRIDHYHHCQIEEAVLEERKQQPYKHHVLSPSWPLVVVVGGGGCGGGAGQPLQQQQPPHKH
jgi:hypothetical protein